MATYFLSVDGGGTSSTFLAASPEGAELARFTVGSTSAKSVGCENAFRHIADGLSALENAGLPLADCAAGVWGLSGVDSAADANMYRQELARQLSALGASPDVHHVCNDALLVLAAQAPAPAVAVISGTGSISLAVNSAGETSRAGGLGYHISDLGSGCRMGAALLQAFALWVEGVAPAAAAAAPGTTAEEAGAPSAPDVLTDDDPAIALITEALRAGAADPAAPLPQLLQETCTPAALATLAFRVLSDAAAAQSQLCHTVAAQGAAALAGYAGKMLAWLATGADAALSQPIPVVTAGGMFRIPLMADAFAGALFARARTLNTPVTILPQTVAPEWGGIRIAQSGNFFDA